MQAMQHFRLGASMYVPAARQDKLPDIYCRDLIEIANGRKFPNLRSVIFCTEDAVRAEQLPVALDNLRTVLPQIRRQPEQQLMIFIRARNPHVLGHLLEMRGITAVDGFVLPKVQRHNIRDYMGQFQKDDQFMVMPTLETPEAFDEYEMKKLRGLLTKDDYRKRILTLRIGGNDLLHCLGIRRSVRRTIYKTALANTIAMLVGVFKPHDFNLSAPVFEGIQQEEVLRAEIEADLDHGLFGKTAIHPNQIDIIHSAFKVDPIDLHMAEKILAKDAPAVFKLHGTMCEPSTHWRAAQAIVERARIYGVNSSPHTVDLDAALESGTRLDADEERAGSRRREPVLTTG